MSNCPVAKNLAEVRDRIVDAAVRAGRPVSAVELIAVSKTVPVEAIQAAYAAGQRVFGESRVRELEEKTAQCPEDCQWHMIGHLQRNKVRQVLRYSSFIHSVDSVMLLERIDRIAAEEGLRPSVLLEVNLTGEPSKFGVAPEQCPGLMQQALGLAHLQCSGLMTMAPYGAEQALLHQVFGGLRRLRDEMQVKFDVALPDLSMGMSDDFEVAIAEGATWVRVGSAIFGER